MTIERIWQTGFELADAREFSGYTGSLTFAADSARTGSYAYQFAANTYLWVDTEAPVVQTRVGLHVRHSGDAAGEFTVFALRSTTTDVLRLTYNAATAAWTVYAGAVAVQTAEDSGFNAANTYSHLGLDASIAATGWVYLYRDGVLVLSYVGQTDQGGAAVNRLVLGSVAAEAAPSAGVIDDVYWDNSAGEAGPSALPDLRFVPIYPTGSGAYSAWAGSDGDSVDNYALVDDAPADGDSTYVETAFAGQRDAYTMSHLAVSEGWIVSAVIPMALVRKLDSHGAMRAKLFTRAFGVDADGAAQPLGTDYRLLWVRQASVPGGGTWDQAALDAVELGIASE